MNNAEVGATLSHVVLIVLVCVDEGGYSVIMHHRWSAAKYRMQKQR
jgi:hypothetical protein